MPKHPTFEVGDTIRIDDYKALKARASDVFADGGLYGFAAGFVDGMKQYCGTIQVVAEVLRFDDGDIFYRLMDAPWNWSADMFDLSYCSEPELDFEITEDDILNIL